MNLARKLLTIVAWVAVGYAIAALFLLGTTDFGVATAIAAGCWLTVELTHVIEREAPL